MSNSVDPDETAHYEPSHLDLCCLQKPIIMPVAVKELKCQANFIADDILIFFYFSEKMS